MPYYNFLIPHAASSLVRAHEIDSVFRQPGSGAAGRGGRGGEEMNAHMNMRRVHCAVFMPRSQTRPQDGGRGHP